LTQESNTLATSIRLGEKTLTEQKERKARNEKQLKHRTKECDDELDAYTRERNKRNKERDIVDKVIRLVQNRLSNLRAYLKKRMDH